MRIVGNPPSGGKKPTTPTIGTATDGGTGTTVSVAFTPSTYIGKSTITYTATSSPGSLTGTGSGSPITVSGLTTGTAYTFTVKGTTAYGVVSDYSAASNSVTPASPSSFESIATVTGSGQSTITFSSIPSTYNSLQLRVISRGDGASSGYSSLNIVLNSDTGSNYTYHALRGTGSTISSVGYATGTYNFVYADVGTPGDLATANLYGVGIIDFIDYASASKYATVRTFAGMNDNTATTGRIRLSSSLWLNTSPITSMTITIGAGWNFKSGSSIALYGIK